MSLKMAYKNTISGILIFSHGGDHSVILSKLLVVFWMETEAISLQIISYYKKNVLLIFFVIFKIGSSSNLYNFISVFIINTCKLKLLKKF